MNHPPENPNTAQSEGRKLPFLDHLEELRVVLLRAFACFLVCAIAVGCLLPKVANLLTWPLNQALSHVGPLGDNLQGLVTTRPMGVISVLLQVCFLGGLCLSLPFIFYFVAQFLAPAIAVKERKILLSGILVACGLFMLGALLSYGFLIPATLVLAIKLNHLLGFELIWSASDYYSMVVWMTLSLGLPFEFPLLIFILNALGVIRTQTLKNYRKHVFVFLLIVAAFINPSGDPIALFLIGGTLYLLYELSIWVGGRLERRRLESEENLYA